jgi:estrogen-related receptor beta like 1
LCFVVHVADAQDWRAHLEQMQKHRSGIDEALATTKSQLDKLHSDIELTLEKISSREKFLNNQLEPLLIQYRSLQVSNNKSHYVSGTGALFTLTGTKYGFLNCPQPQLPVSHNCNSQLNQHN